jgi:O-antigen/teichoic acid export membrane protein
MNKLREFLFTNRTTRQTVMRNGFWRFSTAGFLKGVRFVAVVLAARWLGPAEFGSYSYAIAFGTIVFIFSEWGINVLLTRDAQDPTKSTNELFSTALVLKTILTFVSLGAGIVLAVVTISVSSSLVLLVTAIFAIGNIRELFVSVMTAKHRNELETLTAVIEGVVTLALLAALFYLHRTVTVFMTISLLVTITGFIVSGSLLFYKLKIRLTRVTAHSLRRLFMEGFPLALFGILSYLFFASDQLLIQHFLGSEQVGYYSFATRIIYTLVLIPTLLTSVIFPVFAKKLAEGESVRKLFQKVTAGLAALGGACALIIFFGKNLVLIAAPQYRESLPVLTVLGALLVVIFVSLWLDYVLVAVHRQKQDFIITLCAAIVNIILNFFTIPRFGILGAAYATVISQCLNVLATYVYAAAVLARYRVGSGTAVEPITQTMHD